MFYIYLTSAGISVIQGNAYLLIFCVDDISTDVSEALKSLTTIVQLSISQFMSINICFIHLDTPILSA